jgi:uncharacterized protein (TIGR03067 family)
MTRVAVALLLAGSAVAAPVPKALKPKAPPLEGRWEAVVLRSSGNDFTKSTPWVWEISGETVTRHVKNGDGTLRLDGTATLTRPDPDRPADMDYTLPSGNGPGSLFRAVVEVSGDELVINFAELNQARPPDMTELRSGYYYKFKRIEDK